VVRIHSHRPPILIQTTIKDMQDLGEVREFVPGGSTGTRHSVVESPWLYRPFVRQFASLRWVAVMNAAKRCARGLQRTEREDESDCGAQAILATASPGQEAREGGVHVIHFKRPESETLGDPQIDAAAGHEGKVSL